MCIVITVTVEVIVSINCTYWRGHNGSAFEDTVGDCCEIEEYQDDMPHGEHQLAAGSTAGGPSSSGELCPTTSGPVTAVEVSVVY